MVYFNQKPYSPQSSSDAEQSRRVLEFKEKFPKEGLWSAYKGAPAFKELFRKHLINFLRDKFSGLQTQSRPQIEESRPSVSAPDIHIPSNRRTPPVSMFPGASPARFEHADLNALGMAMISALDPVATPESEQDLEENIAISAGYEFLADFIYHDLTIQEGSDSHHGFLEYALGNTDPSYSLRSVYGDGPSKTAIPLCARWPSHGSGRGLERGRS